MVLIFPRSRTTVLRTFFRFRALGKHGFLCFSLIRVLGKSENSILRLSDHSETLFFLFSDRPSPRMARKQGHSILTT